MGGLRDAEMMARDTARLVLVVIPFLLVLVAPQNTCSFLMAHPIRSHRWHVVDPSSTIICVASKNKDDNHNNNDDPVKNLSNLLTAVFVEETNDHDDDDNNQTLTYYKIINVPGEGDCMFLAVFRACGWWHASAHDIRQAVAGILERSGDDKEEGDLYHLLIEGNRTVSTAALLQSAARSEGIHVTPEEYIRRLRRVGRQGGLYGGGPELTVMSNLLRRPIYIYELDQKKQTASTESSQKMYHIELKGIFGKDAFRDPLDRVRPKSAVQEAGYPWEIRILVIGSNEKHACILVPQKNRYPQ